MYHRKIIHIDMDAFFASVEQLDNPEYRGKPLCVGGGEHGVVAAASYEARKYGVRSAMPGKIALQKCPHLIVVPPRFDRYKEISMKIRAIFYEYTDLVEPMSLDEAYLDVTENKKKLASANEIAREIRNEIYKQTGLTASAGISVNKFLAKVASDVHKPNGQKTIHPTQIECFMDNLPIEKFYGVGKVTALKMHENKIYTGKDLKSKTIEELIEIFGKSGKYYYEVARGIHKSEVKPNRIPKSMGVEETFWKNLWNESSVLYELKNISDKLENRLKKKNIKGKTITLKIKYKDFSVFTRSSTQGKFISKSEDFFAIAKELWTSRPFDSPIRLLGISVSNLNIQEQKQVSIQLKIPFPDFY